MELGALVNSLHRDVYLYYGEINRIGYSEVSRVFEAREEKLSSACLVLITYGGDPDAAYRIARACYHYYRDFEILIPDVCKSAGTLLCIGAKRLIFGDRGELGPLDIQLSKPDEMFESMSGLDIIQALKALENQVLTAFRSYLVDIRQGSRIRTSLAADIAAKLADGFIAPIAAKIDPVTLGEHQRAMQIAFDYGERLSKMSGSLKADALVKLVSSYPSHGFVIDRKEAASLFECVSEPIGQMRELYLWARGLLESVSYPKVPLVMDIKSISSKKQSRSEADCGGKPNSGDDGVEGENEAVDGDSKQEGESNESDAEKSI